MSEKIKNASTSVGELDQRDRRSQDDGHETESAVFDRQRQDAEVLRLQKSMRDLIEGMRWLLNHNAPKWETKGRLEAQIRKINAVERKLFHIQQRMLL